VVLGTTPYSIPVVPVAGRLHCAIFSRFGQEVETSICTGNYYGSTYHEVRSMCVVCLPVSLIELALGSPGIKKVTGHY
jgi:hypothetical protein